MENTTHYGLKKWDPEDRVLRTEFNDNSDKTDAGIAEARAAADGAAQTAQTALSKAQSAQTTLTQQGSSIAALQAALAARGDCNIEYGTYTGDGATTTRSRTFSGTPYLVLLTDVEYGTLIIAVRGEETTGILNTLSASITLTWSGKKLSWYCSQGAGYQMNTQGRLYAYLAFTKA